MANQNADTANFTREKHRMRYDTNFISPLYYGKPNMSKVIRVSD